MPFLRILSLGVLFASTSSYGQEHQPAARWISDPTNGCRVWSPAPSPNETIAWNGGCLGGYAQGRGVLQWYVDGRPARRDEGEFRDGKLTGAGLRVEPDGGRYEGFWRGGRAHGAGRYVAPDGNVFEGFWRNGCPDQGANARQVGASPGECGGR